MIMLSNSACDTFDRQRSVSASYVSGVDRAKDFLRRLLDKAGEWHDRAAQRRQLAALDDRMLSDIGIDRATAATQASKPFWQA